VWSSSFLPIKLPISLSKTKSDVILFCLLSSQITLSCGIARGIAVWETFTGSFESLTSVDDIFLFGK